MQKPDEAVIPLRCPNCWQDRMCCCAGLKWALVRQPSATLLTISVQATGDRVGVLKGRHVYTWRRPTQEEEEGGDEEAEAIMEVSDDDRGYRSLVCHQPELDSS